MFERCWYKVVTLSLQQNTTCHFKHVKCCVIDFRVAEAIGWLQVERVELPDGDWKYIKLR